MTCICAVCEMFAACMGLVYLCMSVLYARMCGACVNCAQCVYACMFRHLGWRGRQGRPGAAQTELGGELMSVCIYSCAFSAVGERIQAQVYFCSTS